MLFPNHSRRWGRAEESGAETSPSGWTLSAEEFTAHRRSKLAGYKVPKAVEALTIGRRLQSGWPVARIRSCRCHPGFVTGLALPATKSGLLSVPVPFKKADCPCDAETDDLLAAEKADIRPDLGGHDPCP